MTPTDAARRLLESKSYAETLGILSACTEEDLARALLDAETRIAALEAENAVMRRCLTDIRDNYDCDVDGTWHNYDCDVDGTWHNKHCRCCKADGALSYKYAPTLTPEGGPMFEKNERQLPCESVNPEVEKLNKHIRELKSSMGHAMGRLSHAQKIIALAVTELEKYAGCELTPESGGK